MKEETLKTMEEKPNIKTIIESISGVEVDKKALEKALREAAKGGSTSPLLNWAQKEGLERKHNRDKLEDVIGDTMLIAGAIESAGLLAGLDGAFSTALVTSAVQGFTRSSNHSSGGRARIEHLRGQVEELTALHRVISAANSSRKLNDMLQETASAVVAVTNADNCSIFLFEPEWDQLVLAASTNPEARPNEVRLRLGEGITGWSAMAGIPVAVRDVQTDGRFKNLYAPQKDEAVSMLAVPVVLFAVVKLVGVITIKTFQERDWSDNRNQVPRNGSRRDRDRHRERSPSRAD